MRTVWKYVIPVNDEEVGVPWSEYNKVVHVGLDPADPNNVAIWVEREYKGVENLTLHCRVVGTGHTILDNFCNHLGSVQQGPFMWHVYGRIAS